VSRAAEALALRAWAMQRLAGGDAPPPAASAEAWRLFCAVERCALALCARLSPGEAPPPLREAFDLEIQRVLSLRALLRSVDRALAVAGATGIALKGAVPALAGGEPLDVLDLDLLVAPEAMDAITAALEAEGLGVGRDTAPSVPTHAPGGHERAARTGEGTVHVELHVVIPLLPEAVDPLRGSRPSPHPRVRMLAPAVHLWHVLMHGAVQHPERRGMLREMLLLRDAGARCTAEERAEVVAMLAGHPLAGPLGRALDAAADPARWAEPFAAEAALRYALAVRYAHLLGERVGRWLSAAAYALLMGRGEYRRLWYGAPRSAWGAGATPGGPGAVDLLRPARFLWRGALLAAVTPFAVEAVRASRRLRAG
jgi:hypothetical protein